MNALIQGLLEMTRDSMNRSRPFSAGRRPGRDRVDELDDEIAVGAGSRGDQVGNRIADDGQHC
jgi:hypothetical protein